MIIQYIITAALVGTAVYILYKNIKSKGKGDCNCGSCSSHCPSYKKEK